MVAVREEHYRAEPAALAPPDVLEEMANRLPAWQALGACRGEDPDLWFPDRGDPALEARAICAVCPVLDECLDYAIADDLTAGIFGGLGHKARRRVAREGLTPIRTACKRCRRPFVAIDTDRRYCGQICALAGLRERENETPAP